MQVCLLNLYQFTVRITKAYIPIVVFDMDRVFPLILFHRPAALHNDNQVRNRYRFAFYCSAIFQPSWQDPSFVEYKSGLR